MNIHAPLDNRAYDSRMWWVMLAGSASRFSAERAVVDALSGFIVWALIFAACWLVRARSSADAERTTRLQRTGNIIALLGLFVFLLRLGSGELVPAMFVMLFAVQAAVFVTASKRLHAWLILAAALAGVLFAAAESRSASFLLCAAWFTFAALGLLALDHRHDRESIMLLQSPRLASRSTGSIAYASIALLCTLPVYLFIPKPGGLLVGGMQARTAHDYRAGSDTSDAPPPRRSPSEPQAPFESDPSNERTSEVDRTPARPESGDYGDNFSVDDVRRDGRLGNAIVMYVKSTRPINLRGRIYDRFENSRWYRDPQPFEEYSLERGNLTINTPPLGNDAVQQSIEILRTLDTTLVHAPGVRRLRFPSESVRRYDDEVFVAPQPLRAQTTYSVESRLILGDGRYLLAMDSPADLDRYLAADAASERMRTLAQTVTDGLSDARAKAFALEAHLRSEYQYSYETIEQQGYTPLDWFLFEGKRGHCEYFASALAMLLRTVGIPSRVATGFSLSAPNPVTGYYEVRALDGHAWVEAHIDGHWIMLEPTPFYPLPRANGTGQVAEQLDGYLDRIAQTHEVLDPEAFRTQLARIARDAWRSTRDAMRSIAAVPRALGWIFPAALVLGALVGAIAYLALMAVADGLENRDLRSKLSRAAVGRSREATLLLAQALQEAFRPRGVERHAGASFREFVASLDAAGLAVPAEFADGFDSARYGDADAEVKSDSTRAVAALIESQIRSNPWPRTRRTLDAWRDWIQELFRR